MQKLCQKEKAFKPGLILMRLLKNKNNQLFILFLALINVGDIIILKKTTYSYLLELIG